jgi:ABC-type multidrug transport system fused ATPase/permease subunit
MVAVTSRLTARVAMRIEEPDPGDFAVRRVVAAGLALGFAAVSFQFVVDMIDSFALDNRVANFDSGQEGNLTTWFSTAMIFAGAFAALLHALVVDVARRTFLAAAALLAYLSLDELAQVHENFDHIGHGTIPTRISDAMDIIAILPVLVLALATLELIARRAPDVGRFIRIGYLTLIAAVLTDEAILPATKALLHRGISWPEEIRSAVEEGLELGGFTLVTVALAAVTVRALIGLDRPSTT